MGCHTWCYKRNTKPISELRKECAAYLDFDIKDHYRLREEYKQDPSLYAETHYWGTMLGNTRRFNKKLKRLMRVKRRVELGSNKLLEYIYEHQPRYNHEGVMQSSPSRVEEIKGIYYSPVDEYGGNLFRIRNYPEDTLTSFEQTIAMLEREKNGVWEDGELVEDNVWVRDDVVIKEFWDKYPDGLIHMG